MLLSSENKHKALSHARQFVISPYDNTDIVVRQEIQYCRHDALTHVYVLIQTALLYRQQPNVIGSISK